MNYLHQYLKRFERLFLAPGTIEVAVNANGSVWLETAGDVHMQPVDEFTITPEDIHDLATQIANDRDVILNDQNPIVSASVPFEDLTLRAQAIVPPATAGGTVLAFRVFGGRQSGKPKEFHWLRGTDISLSEERRAKLIALKDETYAKIAEGLDVDQFLSRLVEDRLNVVISGGTSTGKTELGRRLLSLLPPEERLVTIEDSAELLPDKPNVVSLIADRREESARSADKLLQASLRLRPDRIVVGELRGSEVVTFLDAINTGHNGSFTTVHADHAEKALDRLALMVLATSTNLSYSEVMRYLEGSIDVVIQTDRHGSRRGIAEFLFPSLTMEIRDT